MSHGSETLAHFDFVAAPERLVEVRRFLESAACKTTLSRKELNDLLTAVDEAAANAVCHGRASADRGSAQVSITCEIHPNGLVVTVQDNGPGFQTTACQEMPAPEAVRGRGLPMISALSDSVEISANPHGTILKIKKFAGRSDPA